ncbi:uncharacterized protein F5147DRAFT_655975 [Suillus discolor]|uniref:DUF6532 domain-containing protein n=1 Tax=Suillus discolor TaxID=1912936 RepID=A0A9P7EYR4_9AGAM|nr:uncharacterized protein F5147DRAFT_655975 [Suillus discolor]KAG2098688.1 hypothetical protein F5147DRAFT_655975 [Suillus discolor]
MAPSQVARAKKKAPAKAKAVQPERQHARSPRPFLHTAHYSDSQNKTRETEQDSPDRDKLEYNAYDNDMQDDEDLFGNPDDSYQQHEQDEQDELDGKHGKYDDKQEDEQDNKQDNDQDKYEQQDHKQDKHGEQYSRQNLQMSCYDDDDLMESDQDQGKDSQADNKCIDPGIFDVLEQHQALTSMFSLKVSPSIHKQMCHSRSHSLTHDEGDQPKHQIERASKQANPLKLEFYPTCWQMFLQAAKLEMHLQAVLTHQISEHCDMVGVVGTRMSLLSDESSDSTEAERGLALTERQGFLRRSRVSPSAAAHRYRKRQALRVFIHEAPRALRIFMKRHVARGGVIAPGGVIAVQTAVFLGAGGAPPRGESSRAGAGVGRAGALLENGYFPEYRDQMSCLMELKKVIISIVKQLYNIFLRSGATHGDSVVQKHITEAASILIKSGDYLRLPDSSKVLKDGCLDFYYGNGKKALKLMEEFQCSIPVNGLILIAAVVKGVLSGFCKTGTDKVPDLSADKCRSDFNSLQKSIDTLIDIPEHCRELEEMLEEWAEFRMMSGVCNGSDSGSAEEDVNIII